MIGPKVTVSLTLLSALVIPAFMAPSASAAIAGTTAFTCAPSAAELPGFTDEHCTKAAPKASEVKRKHVAIAQDKITIIHGTNANTTANTKGAESAILKSTFLGVEVEILCEKVFAHAKIENKFSVEKEHYIHGEKVEVIYTGCKYIKPSTCKVTGEEITVPAFVTATTEKEGDNVRFKPVGSETLATIKSEGFGCPAEVKVNGTARAQVEGATLVFNEAKTTADKSLTFAGNAAGLEGKITLSQAADTGEASPTGNPIAATTVET